ncbi:transglutaminase family protein [Spirillospora sp. NPDC127200]
MTIDPFLQESPYCDASAASIQDLVKELRGMHGDDRELAVATFYFVRDHIRYEAGDWRYRASETLLRGRGTCTNSANLMVALLRGAGIPAGYGIMSVRGPEFLGPVVPWRLTRHVSKVGRHVYVYTRIDGEWRKCDPCVDLTLSLGMRHLFAQAEIVDWDGRGDGMLKIDPRNILEDDGPVAEIDPLMRKRTRLKIRAGRRLGNLFLEHQRQEGARISRCSEVEAGFKGWLRRRHPLHYFLYSLIPVGGRRR